MDSFETVDERLLEQIGQRDRDALRQFYRRHGARVYSLAVFIVRNPSAAEEVTQEVFLKVWEKSGTFVSSKSQALTWLLRITRNHSIDWLRREKPRQELPDDLASSSEGPEEIFAADTLAEGVRLDLARLPDAQRRVLTMAYYQGMTHRQISKALEEPLGTVKSRIREALLGLRKRMQR